MLTNYTQRISNGGEAHTKRRSGAYESVCEQRVECATKPPFERRWVYLKALLFLFCSSSVLAAALTDKPQPLVITADKMQYNLKTNIGTYQDHVTLQQNGDQLMADKLIVYLNAEHKLIKAIATGNPVHYKTVPDHTNPPIDARADEMRYLLNEHRIVLMGNAVVRQGQDEFRGDHIEYDTVQEVITSIPTQQHRTILIIQPKPNASIK